MGAKGIRRRKKYRRLSPPDVANDDGLGPPHVMWPARGSGFEAFPGSPAGNAELNWKFVRRFRRGGPHPLVVRIVFGLALLMAVMWAAAVLSMLL